MRVIKIKSFLARMQIFNVALKELGSHEARLAYLKKTGIVSIGKHTYGRPIVFAWDKKTKLNVGKYCSIAANVTFILGGNHRVDWISTYPFNEFHRDWPNASDIEGHPSTRGDINVGNDVWIGHGALILSGVNIGDGAVIGAASVISRDVAAYSVVAGNPAKEIRLRFSREEIDKLLEIKWWDWPESVVSQKVENLCNDIKKGLSNLEKHE
jgi:acetyltransferase-like isoleucine patch superfamily enzyme